ncbi:hypothetical protein CI105_01680 [Candidatus Izimaplasma bacterium ZiA1]|uniref:hypothetical protein n=1 Tax=Candidatus Izimoplasma sp. ZiA1 TaxID=2024899 RepID=UPI000BAA6767|nr:hypothetical protein CI105_01680 [Candidatus Izimaplasma bacterium ZiA1]
MRKFMILTLFVLLLSGCTILERGNYEENKEGYVFSNGLVTTYRTNFEGKLEVFLIDQTNSFFEAITIADIDLTELDDFSLVNETDLITCGVTEVTSMPKFIKVGDKSYVYNISNNGDCSYDEYTFHALGYTSLTEYTVSEVSPVENDYITLFRNPDFYVNPFDNIVFIENIEYNAGLITWEKSIFSPVPMSIRQEGNMFNDNQEFFDQIRILENYLLVNQSINLLVLKTDYDPLVDNTIWSEETIEKLGRDNDVIKKVKLENCADILEIITDTLSRLGMFN